MLGRVETPRPTRALAAYIRVSTVAQAASGIGLAAQRLAILEASQVQGFEIASWHEDAGKSGATITRRAGLRAALGEVAAGRVGGIVVAKVDRLGRSSADVTGLVERAQREGWRLLALDCGLDTTTPAGELVAAALAMAARFEWRRISERQREKHDQLRRQRRPRGQPATPVLLADRIISLRDAGLTYARIAETLNHERVPTTRGGRRWEPATARSAEITRRRELAASDPTNNHPKQPPTPTPQAP
jgi:DNA invertase Pin-like site-specific DNA recombinase